MTDIVPPKTGFPITEGGTMLQRFRDWTQLINRQVNKSTSASGTGSPEGVVVAETGKFYTDTAVPDLYWKSVDDVAGDTSMGWILK